ncbi:MAG: hypothetical protein JNK65_04155, partial [Deltaproteobacteria bacterium]|nr:hypothetical protein [Deltaproteobacteria bacterium]
SLAEEENTFQLYRFANPSQESFLQEATQELLNVPKKERTQVVVKELKKLVSAQKKRLLGEIDPGWFFEILKNESPQIISLVLQNLPQDQAKGVLEKLSSDLKKKIPKLDKNFKLSEDILEIVRSRFESHFAAITPPERSAEIDLHHLYFIKVEELFALFRDLGVEQLARAFQGLYKGALKALLNRLPIKDAKELQARVKILEKLSVREMKEAQMLLLNLPIETIEPDDLFLEVGMVFFSKGITRSDRDFLRALQYKLPPKYGYLLKRYVDGSLSSTKPAVVEWARRHILDKFQNFPTD